MSARRAEVGDFVHVSDEWAEPGSQFGLVDCVTEAFTWVIGSSGFARAVPHDHITVITPAITEPVPPHLWAQDRRVGVLTGLALAAVSALVLVIVTVSAVRAAGMLGMVAALAAACGGAWVARSWAAYDGDDVRVALGHAWTACACLAGAAVLLLLGVTL